MRPVLPTAAQLPFEVPDSIRLIDPTLPEGATLLDPPPAGWFDPAGNADHQILNHYVNFGWEYVWHCHILAHEEMDMMHSLVAAVPPRAPTGLTAAWNGSTSNRRVTLIWTDNSSKEVGSPFRGRRTPTSPSGLTTFHLPPSTLPVPGDVTFVDTTVANNTTYWYRVVALGDTVGDNVTAGFPTASADSVSNTASGPRRDDAAALAGRSDQPRGNPAGRTAGEPDLEGQRQQRDRLRASSAAREPGARPAPTSPRSPWRRTEEQHWQHVPTWMRRCCPATATSTGCRRERAAGRQPTCLREAPSSCPRSRPLRRASRLSAVKADGNNYTATLTWTDNATNETNFTIQRATNLQFTTGLTTATAAGNAQDGSRRP